MKRYVAIKCTMLVVTLGLGFAVLHNTHGQKGAKKAFIKPPAVKLVPDKESAARLHQLALKAQGLIDEKLIAGSSDIKSMMMNHAVTVFFPYGLSMAMSADHMADLVRGAVKEAGITGPITVDIDSVQWFGGPKQHTLVVRLKQNEAGMPHKLNTLLESKTKGAGLLPQSYKSKFGYNPHSSLIGITGAGEERLVLEGDNLKRWQDISEQDLQAKKDIVTELNSIVSEEPFTFDKLIVYGTDFQPKAHIPLQ